MKILCYLSRTHGSTWLYPHHLATEDVDDASDIFFDAPEELCSYEDSFLSCAICCENNIPAEFVLTGKVVAECEHDEDQNVCVSCLSKHISAQLDWKAWNSLHCPLCSAKLDCTAVETWSPPHTVERYHKLMLSDTFKDEPRFRSCLRLNCGSSQIHAAGDAEPLMTCGSCGYKMCYVHGRPWHEGQTCSQYDQAQQHLRQEEASAELIAKTAKSCPNKRCKAPIEKDEGCDHMTCTRCRYEFCWECFAEYKAILEHGNTGHNSGCRWHSENLPTNGMLNPRAYFTRN